MRYRPAAGASKSHSSVRQAFRKIAASAYWSTVAVYCDGRRVALGTVVDSDGHVLTKASEIRSTPEVRLRTGARLTAKIVATDKTNDVALLKVRGRPMRPVAWSASDNPPVGSWIVTPGLGADPVAIGVVSVAARTPRRPARRRPGHGFLGISFATSGTGARIERVIPNTAAARAGLRRGDLITKGNDKPLPTREDLLAFLRTRKPGDKVNLHVRRGPKEIDLTATLGKWLVGRQLNPQEHMGGELSLRSDGFARILQHDSVLKPPDCGGPALDSSGKAVGINIARAGRVESYILPHSVILPLLDKLKAAKPKPTPKAKPTPKPETAPAKPKAK